MEKNGLKQEIDVLIESIKKQADRMNAQNNLSMVELEVLHHKIQKLYEKSILIHHLPVTEEKKPVVPEVSLQVDVPQPPPVIQSDPGLQEKNAVTEEKTPEPFKQTVDLFGEPAKAKPAVKAAPEKERVQKTIRKPIPDLKAAISINDKFRFINELFQGNATEFNIALNQINSCEGSDDADTYITNIREIYQWKDENESVGIFLDLVERRFL
ncbi:MAG: hypothetical protein ACHQRM_09250 [Bacteroidia bacterium]